MALEVKFLRSVVADAMVWQSQKDLGIRPRPGNKATIDPRHDDRKGTPEQ